MAGDYVGLGLRSVSLTGQFAIGREKYLQEMRVRVLTNDRKAVYYIKRYIVR